MNYVVDSGNVVRMGGNDFTDYGVEGAWAFYLSSCPSEPASFVTTRKLAYNALHGSVYGNLQRASGNTYRNVGRTDVPEWVGWGSTTLTWAQYWGVLGWHLFNDEANLDWLALNIDTVLGEYEEWLLHCILT